MQLDEKFPLPKRESFNTPPKDYYPSQDFPLLFSTRVGHFPCQVCGKLTTWVVLHDNCRNHVCSEECMAKVLEIPESEAKPTAFSEHMREVDEARILVVEDDHEPVVDVAAMAVPVKDAGAASCKYCGNPIPKSGKRGRPPSICDACKARIASGEKLVEQSKPEVIKEV